MEIARRDSLPAYVTRDGSEIREWVAPGTRGRRQSLAEATVPAGSSTLAHFHRESEEIYLVASGTGRLLLGEETQPIAIGDCIVIPPGTVHRLWADPGGELVVVCSCVPPYSHEDTVLVELALDAD
ncbi:MAG TPA: cupin domain-containing protein [Conexibacter sp.]|jgi:mannose-6-phosphate isomerase-like protein (cupin superfamily)|nr:cupin domain-containing protein [Conexibacter sp.]